jgi:RNA polymerase sigma factor (TIGR02999 family)
MYWPYATYYIGTGKSMGQGRSMVQYIEQNNSCHRSITRQNRHMDKIPICYNSIVPEGLQRTMQKPTKTHYITQLLHTWSNGDSEAFDELSPLVYQELRRIAYQCFSRESAGNTLQPTALVNDALLRLMGANVPWHDRKHFYTVAARTMRRILVDHARSRQRKKRGSGATAVTLDEISLATPVNEFELLALNEALKMLEEFDQRKHDIIELRYFAGLSILQTAKSLGISTKTVQRDMRFAEAWLNNILSTIQYEA